MTSSRATRIAGVLTTKSGSGTIRVTFDAPFLTTDDSGIGQKVCCLKQ